MTLPLSDEQLCLFKVYVPEKNNSYWDVEDDSGATYNLYIKPVFTAPESPNGWISFSKSGGTARGDNLYFRYSYRDKNVIRHKHIRVRHKHIRGGNIYNFKAINNAKKVADKIKNGEQIESIIAFIATL